MKFKGTIILLCSIIKIISGCAASRTLGKLPIKPQDFNFSKEEMKTKFPEIAVYERDNIKFPFGYCTEVNDIIKLWGEPDETKLQWWTPHFPVFSAIALGSIAGGEVQGALIGAGIVIAMVPVPVKIYKWHKGNYVINADIDVSIFCGYMKRILQWEWVHVRGTEVSE